MRYKITFFVKKSEGKYTLRPGGGRRKEDINIEIYLENTGCRVCGCVLDSAGSK
jgi:hypothetical protein